MKKFISLIIMLVFLLCGCTSNTIKDDISSNFASSEQNEYIAPPVASVTESLPVETTPSEPAQPLCDLGHSYLITNVESTCAAQGYKEEKCSVCGDTQITHFPLKEHVYTTTYTPSTTLKHNVVNTCSVCNQSHATEQDHTWNEWSVTAYPTTTTTGQQTRDCAVCGQGDIATIPILTNTTQEYICRVFQLVNETRAKNGLSALKYYDLGQQAANIRSQEILDKFEHYRPDGSLCFTVLDQLGIEYLGAGENIGIGQSSPENVMIDWLNSTSHRENMLKDYYTHIIIAYNPNGNTWVQLFLIL